MGEFEEKVRAAFDAEVKRVPARPGLRQRVIANAVATPRGRQWGFTTWLTPPRLALVGAAAAVLIVAGIGIRAAMHTAGIATSPAVLAFGKVPTPLLHPPVGLGAGGATPSVIPYFGPAAMTWSGQLPAVPSAAPVYRFALPTDKDADAFAARLGASLQAPSSDSTVRTYRRPDGYTLTIRPDSVASEPVFALDRDTAPGSGPPLSETAARAAADAELSRLGLTPPWKFAVKTSTIPPLIGQAPTYAVRYQRLITLPSGEAVGEVDGNGDPAGIEVIVDSSGQALRLNGILRLAERSANYPLRPTSDAAKAAVTAPPILPASGQPVPAVTLNKATLVYTVVRTGDVGYMEPAYLFTGVFEQNRTTFEKRVLIPAVAAAGLSS